MFVTFTHMEGRDLGSIYTEQKFKFRKTAISIRLVYYELTFWYTTKCKYHLVKRTILQSHRRVINMSLNKSSHRNGLLRKEHNGNWLNINRVACIMCLTLCLNRAIQIVLFRPYLRLFTAQWAMLDNPTCHQGVELDLVACIEI